MGRGRALLTTRVEGRQSAGFLGRHRNATLSIPARCGTLLGPRPLPRPRTGLAKYHHQSVMNGGRGFAGQCAPGGAGPAGGGGGGGGGPLGPYLVQLLLGICLLGACVCAGLQGAAWRGCGVCS